MSTVIENLGYWTAAPYGDGWATFKRTNDDNSVTMWNDIAQDQCWLDESGTIRSSKHPFYARVDKNGIVLNCYEDIWKLVPHECIVIAVDEMIETGNRFVDGKILPPLPVPETFPAISRKQLAYAVALENIITYDEAIAWAVGTRLPQIVVDVIDRINDDRQRFDATMHFAGSSLFEREHPLTSFFGYLLSTPERTYDAKAIDDIWRKGNSIV